MMATSSRVASRSPSRRPRAALIQPVSLGAWDLVSIAVKALVYGATLAAAGGVFYLVYCRSFLEPEDRRVVARRAAMLGVAAMILTAVRIPITAASMADGASGLLDAQLLSMAWHGGAQREVIVRVLGILLMLPALVRRARPGIGSLLAAALAASSFAWVGHTHAMPSLMPRLLVGAHLIAAAFWLGALGPLFRYAREHEPRQVAAVTARFSALAIGMVGVLIVAGVALLWLMLGRWSLLVSSGYGRTALVKLLLVAGLLGCAAVNKLRVAPRLAAGDRSALRLLRVSIASERVLGAGVLLVTAVLTTLMGPPSLGDSP
jgi:copper resistance protein D